jgi:hypothetical protein
MDDDIKAMIEAQIKFRVIDTNEEKQDDGRG